MDNSMKRADFSRLAWTSYRYEALAPEITDFTEALAVIPTSSHVYEGHSKLCRDCGAALGRRSVGVVTGTVSL